MDPVLQPNGRVARRPSNLVCCYLKGQPGCGSMERNCCWFMVDFFFDFVTLKVGHMKYDDLHEEGAFL